MATGKNVAPATDNGLTLAQQVPGYVEAIETLPEYGGNLASMIQGILAAESWEDLQDDASHLPNAKDIAARAHRIRVDAVYRNLSSNESFDDGTGYYFIVESVDLETSEVIRWQTAAASVKAKLLRLHQLGAIPCVVQLSIVVTNNKQEAVNMNVLGRIV